MEYVIKTNDLTKRYGDKTVVDRVSISIKKGEIYGLIGKNGAGKTTLMKILLGLTEPDSGEITLFGTTSLGKARKRIGALVETPSLYKNETALENMRRFAILSHTTDEGIRGLLRFVGLENTGRKKVREFSLGMRQRLGIAIAMLGGPELLILDEPVNGLDPEGIKEIRDVILELNARGITFLVSSHLLDELGRIATSWGIMSGGVLREELTARELDERCRSALKVTVDRPDDAEKLLLDRFPDIRIVKNGDTVRIFTSVLDPSEINRVLVSGGISVSELTSESMGHESFFIERMGK